MTEKEAAEKASVKKAQKQKIMSIIATKENEALQNSSIDDLKKKGVWTYAAEADGSAYYDTDFSGPAALVFGSEGDGIGENVKKKCDFIVSIPMYGHVNSFNVSTAASVLLCEAARRHKTKAKN